MMGRSLTLAYRDDEAFGEVAQANRKILTDALDQVIAGNVDAFYNVFDPDVTYIIPESMPYGGTFHGLEATRRAHSSIGDNYLSVDCTMEAVLASRDICIMYQTVDFETKGNGNKVTLPIAEVYRFRDGKVIEWVVCYSDAAQLAAAITGKG
jgi:ketosteroid isomerase-like protein